MEEKAILLEDISKVYGNGKGALKVLKGITLSVEKGELVSLMGPSGAGKSTLLNLMGGLDKPTEGTCRIMGENISRYPEAKLASFRNRRLGFVFQLHHLLGEFSALENVMMPLLIRRMSMGKAKTVAREYLERFGLGEREHHKPGELSGGECQRVAVARALAGEPDILLADEPTGSLDSRNSSLLMDMLFETGKEKRTTICIVTHDREVAGRTERTISLRDGELIV